MDASLRRALYKTIEDTQTFTTETQLQIVEFAAGGYAADIYVEFGTDSFLFSVDN